MRTALSVLTLLLALLGTLALGCQGGGKSATTPAHDSQEAPSTGIWGTYELRLNGSGTPELAAIDERSGQQVVDPFVQVDLLSTVFDPATRIWDIQARFTNRTRFTGFGLWTAFYNLNGNKILDQDGFATTDNGGDLPGAPGFGQRKPVIALGKDQERRRFPGGTSLEGHLRIQWPTGATNFNGLRFYLDASFPNARQQPIVENLQFENNTISALIIDWQTASNTEPLNVAAFYPGSPLPVEFPLNDSGIAPDATAGDNIWTASTTAPGELIRVLARDSGGYHFENDLGLMNAPPCPESTEPGTFRPFLDGQQSAIRDAQEAIATNPAEWQQLWGFHAPGSAPPAVNFDCFNVYAAFMGERSTGGYGILPPLHLDSALLPELCYSTFSPGEACPVEHVITAPFRMWLGPKLGDVAWRRSDRIRECGTGNVPFYTLFKGHTGATGIQQIERIVDGPDGADNVWQDLDVPGQRPCIDFATEEMVVVSQGTRERLGHVAMITSVNADPAPAPGQPLNTLFIRWDAIAPGEGCQTESQVNTPVHIGVVPRAPEAVFTKTERNAEPCNPGGDCVPMETIHQSASRDGAAGFTLIINNQQYFQAIWSQHFPGTAPTVNFENNTVFIVGLEEFPTSGHTLKIDCVKLVNTGTGPRVQVSYTHTAPGTGCITEPVMTRLTQMVVVPKFVEIPVDYLRTDKQAEPCEPPACEPFSKLIDNEMNHKEGGYRELITTAGGWESFWNVAFPNIPRPQISFEQQSVIVIGLANRDNRVDIECVRRLPQTNGGVQLEVTYDITAPGTNCEPFTNRYYVVAAINKYVGEVRWVAREFQGQPCEPPPPTCDDYETVVNRQLSYKDGAYRLLINNPTSWQVFWNEAYPNEPPAPEINFETRSIIAISPGIVSQSPHTIEIDCIRRLSTTAMHVEYTRTFPGANCGEPGVWRPLLVVSVPKFNGQITEWIEHLETGAPCEPPDPCTDYRVLTDNAQAPQFEPANRVIRTLAGWEEYWNARYPGTQRPSVNFESEMVIAINVGILDITRRPFIDCVNAPSGANFIRVDWHREFWNPECPFEDGNYSIVVAVPKDPREVEFNQLDDTEFQCR